MNIKSFLIGLSIGAVGGYVTKQAVTKYIERSPESVLAEAKKKFKELGPISGSWIHMNKEPFVKDELTFQVYKGGVSRMVDDQLEQYEFLADAETGTILDVHQL